MLKLNNILYICIVVAIILLPFVVNYVPKGSVDALINNTECVELHTGPTWYAKIPTIGTAVRYAGIDNGLVAYQCTIGK